MRPFDSNERTCVTKKAAVHFDSAPSSSSIGRDNIYGSPTELKLDSNFDEIYNIYSFWFRGSPILFICFFLKKEQQLLPWPGRDYRVHGTILGPDRPLCIRLILHFYQKIVYVLPSQFPYQKVYCSSCSGRNEYSAPRRVLFLG